jgi:hypothetical protein
MTTMILTFKPKFDRYRNIKKAVFSSSLQRLILQGSKSTSVSCMFQQILNFFLNSKIQWSIDQWHDSILHHQRIEGARQPSRHSYHKFNLTTKLDVADNVHQRDAPIPECDGYCEFPLCL